MSRPPARVRIFSESVAARAQNDPAFARALLEETITLFLNGVIWYPKNGPHGVWSFDLVEVSHESRTGSEIHSRISRRRAAAAQRVLGGRGATEVARSLEMKEILKKAAVFFARESM